MFLGSANECNTSVTRSWGKENKMEKWNKNYLRMHLAYIFGNTEQQQIPG